MTQTMEGYMRLNEFKAWFEGYTENIEAAPTDKQWARVKEMVGKIDGTPVTPTIIRDYVPINARPWWERTYWSTLSAGSLHADGSTVGNIAFASNMAGAAERQADRARLTANGQTVTFDPMESMRDLGRAEAVGAA